MIKKKLKLLERLFLFLFFNFFDSIINYPIQALQLDLYHLYETAADQVFFFFFFHLFIKIYN